MILPCDPPLRRPAASLRETRWCFLQQASRHREPVERQQLFRADDVRRSRFPPSIPIRFITNRPSLLSTSSTRRVMASPYGSVPTSCGARRGYSVSLSYPFLERLRQFLSPDGRTGVSSRFDSVSNGPHPFWAKRFLCCCRMGFPTRPVMTGSSTFRLFSLTRFSRTSLVFAISLGPSLLAALVLAAMTAASRPAVSDLSARRVE